MAIDQKQLSVIFVTLQIWGWFPHTKQDSTFNLQTTRRSQQPGKCVPLFLGMKLYFFDRCGSVFFQCVLTTLCQVIQDSFVK